MRLRCGTVSRPCHPSDRRSPLQPRVILQYRWDGRSIAGDRAPRAVDATMIVCHTSNKLPGEPPRVSGRKFFRPMAEKTEQEISRAGEQVKEEATRLRPRFHKPSPAVPCSPDPLISHCCAAESGASRLPARQVLHLVGGQLVTSPGGRPRQRLGHGPLGLTDVSHHSIPRASQGCALGFRVSALQAGKQISGCGTVSRPWHQTDRRSPLPLRATPRNGLQASGSGGTGFASVFLLPSTALA
jgi:hypothetical protein